MYTPSPLCDKRKQPKVRRDNRPFSNLVKHHGLQGRLPRLVRCKGWIFGDELGIGVGKADKRMIFLIEIGKVLTVDEVNRLATRPEPARPTT